jgi:diguanylate cyclase (GGDEF)-like protein/PAS domain S-box-containing protein
MIRLRRRHGTWLIAVAVVGLALALSSWGLLRPLEHAAADARARFMVREVPSDIVIIGIDGHSLDALEQWPWPRHRHAALLARIFETAVPRRVFLDIDFSAPTQPLDDAVLENALRQARAPVLLPTFLRYRSGADDVLTVSRPLPRFARNANLVSVMRETAEDGFTRAWRSAWTIEGRPVPSVIDPDQRLAEQRDVLIDYSISPASFAYVSYVDLLEGRVSAHTLAGKSLFVGNTSVELGDMMAVPVYGTLPGVVVQALATETVARGAPVRPSAWMSAALLAFWTGLAALLFGAKWSRNLAALAAVLLGIAGVGCYTFVSQRLWLDIATPMMAVALLLAGVTLRTLDQQTWRAITYALGMRRRDALLKSIVHSSIDCIVCIDEKGVIKTANPAASRLFGCPAAELIEQPIGKFITLFAGEGMGARLAAMHAEVRECDARTANGEVLPVEISVSRVRLITSANLRFDTERLYTAVVRDIRERRAQQKRLQHQATHDSLTGLPNRAALTTHLEVALGVNAVRPDLVLLMLDLCRFKEVNDTLGHNIGDRVLCEVAQRFAATLGESGFIARIGGDEFTVVLGNTDAEFVAAISQALADCLRSPIDVAGISIEVGVSIGIARFPEDADDAQTLLRHADVAMYVAKRRGSTFEYYDSANDENTVRRLAIGGELRSAIANNALELHFQPQVNLRSGLVESCEALVRWFHPVQGSISPMEFITIAETTDLIRPLTEWTLAGALAQVRAWRERGVHVRIAVNLSARILQDTGFPARLAALLASSGVSASSLELEITESAMMLDPARALRVLQSIDRQGVLVSIDDFGTGYSSLGYLRDLPVHALKLDKSFVMGMRNNADDRIIVESTAQMARALRLELVAEGVESEWDARFLAAAGYDFAQGFRYSGALPSDKCLQWIVEFNATAMMSVGDTREIRCSVPDRPDSRALELLSARK